MQDGVIPLFSRDRTPRSERRGGWSNQDLAELYRIEAALVQAGIPIDTELGETDEGDPWFAFCRADTGDVLVHVAIIDGEYHIAGASSAVIVKGYSFTDIVRQFMTREPAFLLGTARNNNVMIHPSSVMIAVFAAICLISDEYNKEILAFSAHEKATAGDGVRPESDTYNIVDQRHLTLGEYTFSPQQVFIILSAIAFSASPIVQNNGLGFEAAFGVFDLIEKGAPELEQNFESFVADLWDEAFSTVDPENKASAEYAQALSEQQVERVEAMAAAIEAELAVEAPLTEYDGEGEQARPVASYRTTGEETAAAEDQPAPSEHELIVQTEPAPENEMTVAQITVPSTAYEFFETNAEIAEASEEIVLMIDSIDVQYGVETPVQADSFEITDAGGTLDIGTDVPVAPSTPIVVNTPEIPPSGASDLLNSGVMSTDTYQVVSHYFDLFTQNFGEAEAVFDNGRWLVTNDSATEYGWYADRLNPVVHGIVLEDDTVVYFMGIHGEPGYYDSVA